MERTTRSGQGRRRASARVRRRRAMVGLVALGLVGLLAVLLLGPGSSPPAAPPPPAAPTAPLATGTRSAGRTTPSTSAVLGRVQATLLTARLPAPLSREAALALGHGDVLLLGGLTSADTSSDGVVVLDTATGAVSAVGTLALPTHDAGDAVAGRSALLFGGGQATSVATVQGLPMTGIASRPGATSAATSPATPAAAQVVGQLPGARSDDAAVAVAGTDYVVGGYDGAVGEPVVLATTDGWTFRAVATLPVAVRYPAVAALDGLVYVFGGEAVTGPQAGQPVDDVQVVDPEHHTARIAGHLRRPVEGAAAVDLAGHLYVAGGDTAPAPAAALAPDTAPAPAAALAPDTAPAPAAAPAGTLVTVPTVWRYDRRHGRATVVARLPVAVSHAGIAVSGATAWLVGGETDGTVRAAVQQLRVLPRR